MIGSPSGRSPWRRGLGSLAALALATAALVLAPAGLANAKTPGTGGARSVTGTVESSPTLNVRGGPGTGYNIHGTVASQAKVTIPCWDYGNSVTATWPDGQTYSTQVWDQLADSTGLPDGLWVSDAWINTGGDTSTMVANCNDVPADPTTYPWGNINPAYWDSPPPQDPVDGHGYQQGQCTSFASWEVRTDILPHSKSPDSLGNAYSWSGWNTTSTPHVGEVAQWDPNVHGAGGNGHVAYVAAVYPDTNTILVYEYNWTDSFDNNTLLRLSERTVYLSHTDFTGPPSRYLQF